MTGLEGVLAALLIVVVMGSMILLMEVRYERRRRIYHERLNELYSATLGDIASCSTMVSVCRAVSAGQRRLEAHSDPL